MFKAHFSESKVKPQFDYHMEHCSNLWTHGWNIVHTQTFVKVLVCLPLSRILHCCLVNTFGFGYIWCRVRWLGLQWMTD